MKGRIEEEDGIWTAPTASGAPSSIFHPRSSLLFPVSRTKLISMPRLKAAQRREQLIDVATKLFAKTGYEATTTAAIAEAAGVTEPILYRHFKSKQELFVAIVREMSDQTM